MTIISLQSGSSGNCVFVQSGGMALLVDAGIALAQVRKRLAACGRPLEAVRALVVTHDHADHVSSAGTVGRLCGIPVYMTEASYRASRRRFRLDRVPDLRLFRGGETLDLGEVSVETVPTPHDGQDAVGVIVRDASRAVGVLTDLGHVFAGLPELVAGLDAVVLESNYDPGLLESGGYPNWLKARIRGPRGHLSNPESAGLLAGARRLVWACLAHLSEKNNRPDIALAASRERVSPDLPLYVASRAEAVALPQV